MKTDAEIMNEVQAHHDYVVAWAEPKGMTVIMTVLNGSQNYGLAHENSDIDTYSFVLPSLSDMAALKEPVTKELNYNGEHCNVKDIRLAINLLINTNPNSIEWFTTKYRIFNQHYANILRHYLKPENPWRLIHCNPVNMFRACKGMTYQLKNRNMPVGKKLSHALRIRDMWDTYCFHDQDVLSFRSEETRQKALNAKLCTDETKYPEFEKQIEELQHEFDREKYDFTPSAQTYAKECTKFVREMQKELLVKHLLYMFLIDAYVLGEYDEDE